MRYQSKDINFGQEFLPQYPDGYISEDLPIGDNRCPHCGRTLLHLKGEKPCCTHCYLENKKEHGSFLDQLKESDREYLLDYAIRKIIEDALDPDYRPGTAEEDIAFKLGRD